MKIKNYLLLIYLPLLVLLLVSCQMLKNGRKPQSAGFGGYCPTCLVEGVDKDLKKIQEVMQINNKQKFIPSLKPPIYKVHPNEKCQKGYTEGIKFSAITADPKYYFMTCLLEDKLFGRYKVHADGKCAEGYVKGRAFYSRISRDVDDGINSRLVKWVDVSILCIPKDKLPDVYEVYVDWKCTEGYTEGRKISYNKNYDSMTCIRKYPLILRKN